MLKRKFLKNFLSYFLKKQKGWILIMKKMTEKEEELFRKLQAKKKSIQREEARFKEEVLANKDMVLEILGKKNVQTNEEVNEELKYLRNVLEQLQNVANNYGCSLSELYDYINSEKQVNYYRKTH